MDQNTLALAALGLMDVVSIVLLILQWRYLAKMSKKMDIPDGVTILQKCRLLEAAAK